MTPAGGYRRSMSSRPSSDGSTPDAGLEALERVLPVVRRVVRARVADQHVAEDLVQETLLRIMTAWDRIETSMVEPYAIATARNVVASMWRDRDRESRNRHRALDLSAPEVPEDHVVLEEEQAAIWEALGRLEEQERNAGVSNRRKPRRVQRAQGGHVQHSPIEYPSRPHLAGSRRSSTPALR